LQGFPVAVPPPAQGLGQQHAGPLLLLLAAVAAIADPQARQAETLEATLLVKAMMAVTASLAGTQPLEEVATAVVPSMSLLLRHAVDVPFCVLPLCAQRGLMSSAIRRLQQQQK